MNTRLSFSPNMRQMSISSEVPYRNSQASPRGVLLGVITAPIFGFIRFSQTMNSPPADVPSALTHWTR